MIIPFGFFKAGNGGPPPPTYILDTYPSEAGWSFRKLRTGETYSCKIRRSSDDATTDVELDASGSLTTSSVVSAGGDLGTWISTDDGFIHTMYDQSGNGYDAVQTTNSLQPQIIASGVVNVENSLATCEFDSLDYLTFTPDLTYGTAWSVFAVYTAPTFTEALHTLVGGSAKMHSVGGTSGSIGNLITWTGTQVRQGDSKPTGHNLVEWYKDNIYLNDSEDTPYKTSGTPVSFFVSTIGGREDNHAIQNFVGKMQEVIIYLSDESGGDRSSINSDMKTFFGTP